MDRLEQLLAELAEIDTNLDTLLSHDELGDEQRAEHDGLVAKRARTLAAIQREREKHARAAERARLREEAAQLAAAASEQETAVAVAQRNQSRVRPGANRITTPDLPPNATVPNHEGAVLLGEGYKIPATVKRFGSVKNFRGVRGGVEPEVRAYRMGMWVLAQLTAQLPNRYRFGDAVAWVGRNMTAHSSNDAAGTHFLIPEEFGTDMIDLREQYGVVRQLFKMVPMMSDTRTDPRRTSGLTAYFVAEGSAGTESNKGWDNVRLTAKDLMVIARMSNQVNADAVINLGDDFAGEIAYAFANKEDDCGFNGDGTSTYGGIQGVRTRLDSVDGAGTDSAGLVTQATGNTWPALVLRDFSNVVGKLPKYADTPNTCWVVHRTFYYAVCEPLVLAAGGATAMETRQSTRAPRPIFLGYPVEFAQILPSTTAVATVCAMLGDFGKGASFGDRQQDSISFSEEASVGGQSMWERNQVGIRGTERFDINVHDVGSSSTPGPICGLKTGP